MEIQRLQVLLDDWAKWMHHWDPGLGYPKKSIGMSTGGSSSEDTFDHIVEESEKDAIRAVDALIHSLHNEERKAIYHRYLKTEKPFYYELKLQTAFEKLLILCEQRIY